MKISNSYNQPVYQNINKSRNQQVFTGRNVIDIFTSTANSSKEIYKKFGKKLPIGLPPNYVPSEPFNISKSHVFNIKTEWDSVNFKVDFNPKRSGQLINKQTKEPIDVYVIKTTRSDWPREVGFYFVSKELDKSYGYVEIEKEYGNQKISVNWLQNYDDKKVGGVGKLADKVVSKFCVEERMPLNICSNSIPNSMIAHYKRGKRFLQPKEESREYKFLMNKFGTSDVNEVLNNMIIESERTNKQVNLSLFGEYHFPMVLPKDLAKKYAQEEYTPIVPSQKKSWVGNLKDMFSEWLDTK